MTPPRGTEVRCISPTPGLTWGHRYWVVEVLSFLGQRMLVVEDKDGKVPPDGKLGFWPWRFELAR